MGKTTELGNRKAFINGSCQQDNFFVIMVNFDCIVYRLDDVARTTGEEVQSLTHIKCVLNESLQLQDSEGQAPPNQRIEMGLFEEYLTLVFLSVKKHQVVLLQFNLQAAISEGKTDMFDMEDSRFCNAYFRIPDGKITSVHIVGEGE